MLGPNVNALQTGVMTPSTSSTYRVLVDRRVSGVLTSIAVVEGTDYHRFRIRLDGKAAPLVHEFLAATSSGEVNASFVLNAEFSSHLLVEVEDNPNSPGAIYWAAWSEK